MSDGPQDVLILDALYPPSPDQLVSDCIALGAGGCFAYVWRPDGQGGIDIGNWTPAHVDALRRAGLWSGPIIVPPASGIDYAILLAAVRSFGFIDSAVTLDLEDPNLPPAEWEEGFDAFMAAAGYRDLDYGNSTDLGRYQPDDPEWLARWIRTGMLRPLPTRPPGVRAWQFVNDVIAPSGTWYDASVADPSALLGGGADVTPEEHDALMFIRDQLDPSTTGFAGTVLAGNSAWQQAMSTELGQIRAMIQPGQPGIDLTALRAAVDALARHLGLGIA